MNKWAKIVAGAALLWYGVLRGARGLIVRVQSYGFGLVDLNTVQLQMNVLIKNPLLVGMTIKGIRGEVYAQGVKIGEVDNTYDYYIAGGKTHILPVAAMLSFDRAILALNENIQSGDVRTLTVAFDGKIYVGDWNVGVPLQIDMDYNELTRK